MTEKKVTCNLQNFLTSGFDFDETESYLEFRFRTLNYFMLISSFFGTFIGFMGLFDLMDIGEVQPSANLIYAIINLALILYLRQKKTWFNRIAWIQVLASLITFSIALTTVLHDEFRIAWFYISIYLAYMLLGERAGNIITTLTMAVIIFIYNIYDIKLSSTAIETAILSLIVFGLLSRVYNTQIKSYETKLEDKNYDLAAVIKNLDFALEGAQSANKAKSLFLANMSHEIRTPMNGMLSLVQVLQTTTLDEKQHEYLRSVDRAGSILMTLIDDLLDLSKIEAGNLEINPKSFKVWEFLEDIFLQTEHLFDDSDVAFNVHIDDSLPSHLYTDDIRLKQVVVNLINNAVKFTSKGEINFTMNGSRLGDNFKLHISVTDTGIGIPKDKIDAVFEPFQQLSTRIYNKGVGLGLPISKKIIDSLGGKIHIDSIVGKGTSFSLSFFFPIAETEDYIFNKGNVNDDFELPALDILIVEDDKISRLAINTWLKEKNHRIIIAENGQEAVEYLEAGHHVDIILMDVHMPVMDGIEATKIIKERGLSAAPIIGMTASVMNEERKRYTEAGMDVLVEKPVKFEKLIEIIKSKIH
ncbi:MAG: ATP-binding protein [Woeseiaceae bacterium]